MVKSNRKEWYYEKEKRVINHHLMDTNNTIIIFYIFIYLKGLFKISPYHLSFIY